jgi:hypothetical protein
MKRVRLVEAPKMIEAIGMIMAISKRSGMEGMCWKFCQGT